MAIRLTKADNPSIARTAQEDEISAIGTIVIARLDSFVFFDFISAHQGMPALSVPALERLWIIMECLPDFHEWLKDVRLTTVTKNKQPFRTLARRVDGAFPGPVNPIAVWDIKEYYYTTTFGSRVADGVYESLLDGLELEELRDNGVNVKHYLMIDDSFTWWDCGRSYLCRIIDMLHMGHVDEVLFGKEIMQELPRIVKEWVRIARQQV